jgi:hypothetical protein
MRLAIIKKRLQQVRSEFRAMFRDLRLPTLPEQCEYIVLTTGNTRIGMPLHPPLLKDVRRRFLERGWNVGDYEVSEWGMWQEATARRNGRFVYLTGFPHQERSSCEIKLVGTVEKTESVYEIRCKEDD